jgi:hypothetical protein
MADSSVLKLNKKKLRGNVEEALTPGGSAVGAHKRARALNKPGRTKVHQGVEKGVRSGKTAAARDAEAQVKAQQKAELLRKVESEDEIARRKGLASSKKAGRQSLIRSSPTGLATTLGG